MKTLINAYNAGWRAGMSEPVLITMPNGLKQLGHASNPFTTRWQFLQRFLWEQGEVNGSYQRVIRYDAKRRVCK